MYSQILVPTDGSPASDAAIEHAIDLARHYDARLHALYVVDGAAYSTLEAGADIVVEALESEGKEATRRVADAAADAGVDSETTVATGTAYRSIPRLRRRERHRRDRDGRTAGRGSTATCSAASRSGSSGPPTCRY